MQNSETPDFYAGSPIDADDLRFRDEFLAELWETIGNSHVLLTAPRRTGKTSVMDHLHRKPMAGYTVVSVNVQDLSHPADMIQLILDAFHDEHPKFFSNVLAKGWDLLNTALGRVGEVGAGGFKVVLRESDDQWNSRWRQHGEDFLKQVRSHAGRVLLIIDELPDMLLNIHRKDAELLRDFLSWWRTQRQSPAPKQDNVRWLVGGSVNLSGTLDQFGMVDLINDMVDVPLPTLTPKDVAQFLSEMLGGRKVDYEKSLPKLLIERLGRPIPLFLQMITQDLYRLWKRLPKRRQLTNADLEKVFHDFIKSSAAQDKLQHYYSRIQRYYVAQQQDAAYKLLSQLSLSQAGLQRRTLFQEYQRVLTDAGTKLPGHQQKQLFNQLLRDLENDFYVVEISDELYDFASGVMKAWWRKYYA